MPNPTTEAFLARHGVSAEQARDLLIANAGSPATIYAATDSLGLSFGIIADLLGVSQDEVNHFFANADLSPAVRLLAQHGYTLSDLRPVLNSIAQSSPAELYQIAVGYGVNLDILAEISGSRSAADLEGLFKAHGLDTLPLGGGESGGGVPLVGVDLPEFFHQLVRFNENAGVLSTEAIRAKVLGSGVSEAAYAAAFDPAHYGGAADGTLDPGDLGFSHLGSFAATSANLESLYYGTLINVFNAIDQQEINEILVFTNTHAAALEAGDAAALDAYFNLLQTVYEDPGAPPLFTPELLSDTLALSTSAWIQHAAGQPVPLFGGDLLDAFGG